MAPAPPVRTSRSHPLRIDEVAAGDAGGRIGLTFCPGKCGPSLYDYRWARELAVDLDVIVTWGATAIVTLIEAHEFELLGVPDLGEQVRARGIDWHPLPIPDVQAPGERFATGWQRSGPALRSRLLAGQRVLVHCRGGLGRGRAAPGRAGRAAAGGDPARAGRPARRDRDDGTGAVCPGIAMSVRPPDSNDPI